MIRAFVRKIIILIFLCVGAASAFLCVFKVSDNEIGIVSDLNSGKIVNVFSDKYSIVWQGVLPHKFNISIIPRKLTIDKEVLLPIPPLGSDSDDVYKIKLPFNAVVYIDPLKVVDKQIYDVRGGASETTVYKYIFASCSEILNKYFIPGYRPVLILRNAEKNMVLIKERLAEKLKIQGIELISFTSSGSIYVPSFQLYNEGLGHYNRLIRLKQENELEQKRMEYRISQQKMTESGEIKRLNEISRLIQGNPEMLKYLYIDKMAEKVQVIISSDKTGFPGFLQNDNSSPLQKEGDVDNLR